MQVTTSHRATIRLPSLDLELLVMPIFLDRPPLLLAEMAPRRPCRQRTPQVSRRALQTYANIRTPLQPLRIVHRARLGINDAPNINHMHLSSERSTTHSNTPGRFGQRYSTTYSHTKTGRTDDTHPQAKAQIWPTQLSHKQTPLALCNPWGAALMRTSEAPGNRTRATPCRRGTAAKARARPPCEREGASPMTSRSSDSPGSGHTTCASCSPSK